MVLIKSLILLVVLLVVVIGGIRLLFGAVTLFFEAIAWTFGIKGTSIRPDRVEPPVLGTPCPRDRCGCVNPIAARFCRRCGRTLPSVLS